MSVRRRFTSKRADILAIFIEDRLRHPEDLSRFSVPTIMEITGFPRSTVREALEYFVETGLMERVVEKFRVFYRLVKKVLPPPPPPPPIRWYRTTIVRVYHTNTPRSKTPSPIAEFRITVVSAIQGRWLPEMFIGAVTHMGIILAPQTFWQGLQVTERVEDNEEIMQDEIDSSVPVYKQVDFAERLAIFYISRKDPTRYLEVQVPNWRTLPLNDLRTAIAENTGDYVYDECAIKCREKLVADAIVRAGGRDPDPNRERPRISMKFDNTTGQVSIPLDQPTPKEMECESARQYMVTGVCPRGRVVP